MEPAAGLPAKGIEAGALACVLDVHQNPKLAYEIEVVAEDGSTRFLGAVSPDEIERCPSESDGALDST